MNEQIAKENVQINGDDLVEKPTDTPEEQPIKIDFVVPDLPISSVSGNQTAKEEKKYNNGHQDFPYNKPSWGGSVEGSLSYSLTVLKDGIVKETYDLSKKDVIVFGRLDTCDVVVEHPSCSRYHAVLQYCIEEKDKRKKGFYLCDLGSTHGTYLNKIKVKPKVFNRVRVGYQIKFGGSSRIYIIEGPEEDQEDEVAMDEFRKKKQQYQELKSEEKKKRKTIVAISKSLHKNTDELNEEENADIEEGVGWGFREDAQEEGINLQDLLDCRKDFEVKDPKKTLRNFFEKEGLEFEYEMSTSGSGSSVTHIAKVALPLDTVDGVEVAAEGRSSNKKDAVLACATDACRLLQAYDAMQNAPREDQAVRRRKQLEENDFYESDDDEFLDRTGAIEKKRLTRKKWAGQDENKIEIETYATLQAKLVEAEKQLSTVQNKLEKAKQIESEGNKDSLDEYMMSMKYFLDNTTKTKLKRQTVELTQEIKNLKKLIEKAKPSLLPRLLTSTTSIQMKKNNSDASVLCETKKDANKPSLDMNSKLTLLKNNANKSPESQITDSDKTNKDNFSIPEPPIKKTRNTNSKPESKLSSPEMKSTDSSEDYVGWMPPKGQTGDGRTSLNDKLGY